MTVFHSSGEENLRISRLRRMLVSVFWISGLFLGCILAFSIPTETLTLMRTIVCSRVSIVRLFIFLAIPLVLSFVAVWLRVPFFILPLAFIKAICFSLCASGLILSFGDAGWLLFRLYIFSDSCMVVVLLWFWNRYINGWTFNLKSDFILCLTVLCIICCIDSFLVSPFVAMLFNH